MIRLCHQCQDVTRSMQCFMLASVAILVGCENETFQDRDDLARLVITQNVYTGNNRTFYEYKNADKTASATIEYYYNHPTGDESYSGTLAPIYKAITGASPETPEKYQSTKSILAVFEKQGWQVVEDNRRKVSETGSSQTEIRTIKLRRIVD